MNEEMKETKHSTADDLVEDTFNLIKTTNQEIINFLSRFIDENSNNE